MRFFKITVQPVGYLGNIYSEDEDVVVGQELELDLWPEDDIVCGIGEGHFVTRKLQDRLSGSGLTGFAFSPAKVVDGDQFWMHRRDRPGEAPPELVTLDVTGKAGQEDFGFGPDDGYLVVSERALSLLNEYRNYFICVESEYQSQPC